VFRTAMTTTIAVMIPAAPMISQGGIFIQERCVSRDFFIISNLFNLKGQRWLTFETDVSCA